MENRNQMLEKFGVFFKESNQTTDDASQNMIDLESMSDSQLLTMYKAFEL
jgi:hypothetical protein